METAAHYEDIYEIALQKTKEKRNELLQIFDSHSSNQKMLENQKISLVLDEWGKILGIDVQNARNWFQRENAEIPASINLDSMNFDNFLHVFELWLSTEDSQLRSHLNKAHDEKPSNEPNLDNSSANNNANKEKQDVSPTFNEKLYNENIKKFMDYWKTNRVTIKASFDSKKDASTSKIAPLAVFEFMKEILSKKLVSIRESETSHEDFFENEKNNEKFLAVINQFYQSHKNEEKFDEKKGDLGFEEIPTLIDFWFQTDSHVYVIVEEQIQHQEVREQPQTQNLQTQPQDQAVESENNTQKSLANLQAFFQQNGEMIEKNFALVASYQDNTIAFHECFEFIKDISLKFGFKVSNLTNQNIFQDGCDSAEFDTVANQFYSQNDNSSKNLKGTTEILCFIIDYNQNLDDTRISLSDCQKLLEFWAKTQNSINYDYVSKRVAKGLQNLNNIDIKQNLLNSIANYESMLHQISNDTEQHIIAETIATLKDQLENFENSEKNLQENKFQYGPPKTILKREERRMKALTEVYQHYCKDHSSKELAGMSLAGFNSFISDFELFRAGEEKNKISEVYKKCVETEKALNFKALQHAIEWLADIYYVMEENLKNHSEKIEEFYKHMGLYNGKYRAKLLASKPVDDLTTGGVNDQTHKRKEVLLPYKVLTKGGYKNSAPHLQIRRPQPASVRDTMEGKVGNLRKSMDERQNLASGQEFPAQGFGNYSKSPAVKSHNLNQIESYDLRPAMPNTVKQTSKKNNDYRSQIMERANQIDGIRKKKEEDLDSRIFRNQELRSQKALLKYGPKS